jgi:drug/metabolite transporter (DMT)-like permease
MIASPANTTRRGILVALFAILLFALLDTSSKALGQKLPVAQILWIRYVIFVPIVLLMAWTPGQGIAWRTRRPWFHVARVTILVVEMWFFITAFSFIPMSDVHAIGASAPLIVTALSVPILGEQVGWRRWSAIGVGCIGMLLIIRPGFQTIGWPLVCAVIGAVLWAIYQVMLKIIAREDGVMTTALWTAVIGLVLTSFVGPLQWTPPDATTWLLLLTAALLGGFSHIAYSKALTLAPASAIQPFTYIQIVLVAILGWFAFGDVSDSWTFAGAALIVASGLYTFHRERVRSVERR